MELQHSFLGLIGSISVVHLLTIAGNYLKSWYTKGQQVSAARLAASPERNDWYVFFHCADLLGDHSEAANNRSVRQQPSTGKTAQSQDRRPRRQVRV